MADQIQIKDLLLRATIGLSEEERRDRQDVVLNVVLHADTHFAGQSDDIDDALNYRTLTKHLIQLVDNSRFYLVEKLAAEIAALCLQDARVERVTVAVEKPGALRFARSVGVQIERARGDLSVSPSRVLVSLGSNIDAERNLREATRRLSQRASLVAVSPVYETEPVGTAGQPRFLNAAALLVTELTPAQFRARVLKQIEDELGRVRGADKNAPRTIDLDISMFGEHVLELGGRHIPDPEILERAHLAVPLADLAPDQRFPASGQTLVEIARRLPADGLTPRPDVVLGPA